MAATLVPSIFNDVIGPVMRGPSSSHAAASVRIGLLVYDLCGGRPDRVVLDYDTEGSLATTHESQGTDMGLYGGLLGWEADDPRLADSPAEIRRAGTEIEIRKSRLDDPHPNTYRIHVERGGVTHDVIALSTGGGMIEVIEIDGVTVSLFGDFATTLLWCSDEPEAIGAAFADDEAVDAVSVTGDGPWLVVVHGQKRLDDDRVEAIAPGATAWHLRPVLPVRSRPNLSVPFSHSSELTAADELDVRPLSDWALCATGGGNT